MAEEGIITDLDINFSNQSGQAQKATVRAIVADNSWDFDGFPIPANSIRGELNEAIEFGDTGIDALLKNFTAIELKTSAGTINRKIEFSLQDNLSLLMQSAVVCVRGREIGPLGELDFEDYIYNWTELPDNIKWASGVYEGVNYDPYSNRGGEKFNSGQMPEWDSESRIIKIGNIYNEVDLEDIKGETYTKVYMGGERQFYLETPPENEVWFYNYQFPILAEPEEDRGSWQDSRIRLGYTLPELKKSLDLMQIQHSGIPDEPEFLMEESGPLINVMSSAAQRLGYYWYINPVDEVVVWVSPQSIDSLIVTNYLFEDDIDLLSTSYTESLTKEGTILSYNTTIKEAKREQRDRTQKERKLLKPFKLLRFNETIESVLEYFCGIYYLMWNKDLLSEDFFDKLWFIGMHYSSQFRSAATHLGYTDELKTIQGDTPLDLQQITTTYESLTEEQKEDSASRGIVVGHQVANEVRAIHNKEERLLPVFKLAYNLAKKNGDGEKGIRSPSSEGFWYDLLTTYMDAGMGGIYMSGPISEYRRNRIEFAPEAADPNKGYRIIGPYRWDTFLEDIQELAPIKEFLDVFSDSKTWDKVEDFHKNLYPSWENYEDKYYFFAFRDPQKKYQKIDKQDVLNVFDDRIGMNLIELNKTQSRWLLLKDLTPVEDYLSESRSEYDKRKAELLVDEYITIPYRKLRNPIGSEEYTEEGDDSVPTSNTPQDLDLNREKRKILVDLPTGADELYQDIDPRKIEVIGAEGVPELEAVRRAKANSLGVSDRFSSTRTLFRLEVPEFSPLISNINIDFSDDGITTNITESTLNIIPVDTDYIIGKNNVVRVSKNPLGGASAKKKNVLNL